MSRVLILTPTKESANVVRKLIESIIEVKGVHIATSLSDSIEDALPTLQPFDYVFTSADFGHPQIAAFLEIARRTPSTESSAMVLLLSEEDGDRMTVANSLILGFHSFLSAPLSREKMEQAVKLANSVQLQTSRRRLRTAAGLLLSDIMDCSHAQLDMPSAEAEGNLWERVQQTCQQFKTLTGESVTSAVVNEIHAAPRSQRLQRSMSVRKKLTTKIQRKLLEQLQKFRAAS